MKELSEQKPYLITTLETLVNLPSPSGFTREVMAFAEKEAAGFGYSFEYTRRGGLLITVPGRTKQITGLSAHVDTLGAMVRSVDNNGMLKIISVGDFTMQSIEGEYCTVHTRDGRNYTGTILTKSPAVHSYDDARTLERTERNMEIRLDERVQKKEDVLALGIQSGDYVSFEARFVHTSSGFIKSRHLDDKASAAVLLALLRHFSINGIQPEHTVQVLFSNYEETGTGASYLPEGIGELIAVDMGAVGDDLNGNEFSVSICAMDSSGPYDYELTSKLAALASEKNIPYVLDVFPHYGSDASAAIRAGNNLRAALIGQGIHASHGMERTHEEGLMATLSLLEAYLLA